MSGSSTFRAYGDGSELNTSVKLALAGDTMLGRGVAEAIVALPDRPLLSGEVADAIREADLFVLNLECCISDRGRHWPDPGKPFFFRAPAAAAEVLARIGVSCVTLANNHALDFRAEALLDTIDHLAAAGIVCVGAGADVAAARRPAVLEAAGFTLGVIGLTDHPSAYAAAAARPGVAFADLWREPAPVWLLETIRDLPADAVLVVPHWGPNMVEAPVPHVRAAAARLLEAGATLVAGHSAHVFHGIEGRVLYDLGDFLDDYAVDPVLRNDLGLLFLVELTPRGPVTLEALPLRLEYARTSVATGADADLIRRRFERACAAFGTRVAQEDGRLVVTWPHARTPQTLP
jgi:poly-gamma-glutamate capsule biosynthesis protein CapA/YwtB (metallophosphatase superfamily)